jgi:hypothetical protein
MIRLLIKSGADQGLSLELKPGLNHLGRNAGNELVIEDATISGQHCEITLEDSVVKVRDLNSTNGTFVAGKRIKEAQLQAGQILKVGDVEMSLETNPIAITIPDVNFAEKTGSAVLTDGSIACLNHATVRAAFRCVKCERCFCPACVHKLRLSGGNLNITCPTCSNACELLPGARPKKKKSFFTRLRETLKLAPKS